MLYTHIQSILKQNSVCIVGICGLPGSGKTTTCMELAKYNWGIDIQTIHFSMDEYLYESRSERIQSLKQGRLTHNQREWWDESTATQRLADMAVANKPKIIFVDGCFILDGPIQQLIDINIMMWVDPYHANKRRQNTRRDKQHDPDYETFRNSLIKGGCADYLESHSQIMDYTFCAVGRSNDALLSIMISQAKSAGRVS